MKHRHVEGRADYGYMKTFDVLIVFGVVIIPGALAVFFGGLAALDYAHPGCFFILCWGFSVLLCAWSLQSARGW
jgi:hypothetical protein